jgi:allantoicase
MPPVPPDDESEFAQAELDTENIGVALKSLQHSSSISAVADIASEQTSVSLPACENVVPPSPFASFLVNACSSARVLFATDEWFASADNLFKDSPPIFDPEAYCEQGKVMDGWETRRRREEGHDWCLVQLDSCFQILAVEIDTAHFTGNNTPAISLQIAHLDGSTARAMAQEIPGILDRLLFGCVQGTGATPTQVAQADTALARPNVEWKTLLTKTPLKPGYQETRMHYFTLDQPLIGTHVRVNYYPDGGVARLRLWGHAIDAQTPRLVPAPLYSSVATGPTCTVVSHASGKALPSSQQAFEYTELSSMEHGGVGLICSNQHYGDPWNLIQPTPGKDMGDSWETARHPNRPSVWVKNKETGLLNTPLMDWCILKLGHVADGLARIIIDTKHFRGNYPESVQVDGCLVQSDGDLLCPEINEVAWYPLISRCRMAPDSEHVFDFNQIMNKERRVSHVKVSIFPDGGLSRVRIYGTPSQPP